ncbi:calmodulin-like protein 4 isoform X2 [Arvicanthis niloticus]|uniref:calmodulin-like protein 4 isoform X2 n=1 Tax=Arvicanthis niloticus TaxID=61156 RepID=UPI00402B5A26
MVGTCTVRLQSDSRGIGPSLHGGRGFITRPPPSLLDFRLQAGVKRTKHSSRSKGCLRMAKFLSQDQINDKHGELDFSTFLTIMHMQIKQEDPKKEILLAMLMADKEKKGYIMASELRSKLMKLGEKLTHKEVDDLFKEAGIEPNGQVKYDTFIQRITLPVRDY